MSGEGIHEKCRLRVGYALHGRALDVRREQLRPASHAAVHPSFACRRTACDGAPRGVRSPLVRPAGPQSSGSERGLSHLRAAQAREPRHRLLALRAVLRWHNVAEIQAGHATTRTNPRSTTSAASSRGISLDAQLNRPRLTASEGDSTPRGSRRRMLRQRQDLRASLQTCRPARSSSRGSAPTREDREG